MSCLSDLYPYVITTYAGSTARQSGGKVDGVLQHAGWRRAAAKNLADEYTLNDNYHQPAMGGTGMHRIFLGTGDDFFWSDGNGNATFARSATRSTTRESAGPITAAPTTPG